jgi:hypothetical protein
MSEELLEPIHRRHHHHHHHHHHRRRHRRRLVTRVIVASLVVAALAIFSAINLFPGLGAQAAETLRAIVGDAVVAQLETAVYQVQDVFETVAYRLGVAQPVSPWEMDPTNGAAPSPTAPQPAATSVALAATAIPASTGTPAIAVHPLATLAPTATPLPLPAGWRPAALTPLGALAGEGQWSAYITSPFHQVLAYRAFLQPDPMRPYAVVAIVAFNLNATRLKFVLGTDEPVSPVQVYRPGTIPPGDLHSGLVVAAFNGGFRTRHGDFGVMVGGVTVLQPRAGLGTVAMYADGRVTIGAWGTDITSSRDVLAWRQNGPLILHDGQLNPRTAVDAPGDWGYTVNGATAVLRSGMAISADGGTLYYLAGPYLTLPALATAMAATGAVQGMQLDINNYWVHFSALQTSVTPPRATALLDSMNQSPGRFLGIWSRDFFYVMATGS